MLSSIVKKFFQRPTNHIQEFVRSFKDHFHIRVLSRTFNIPPPTKEDGWMDGWLGFNGILSTQVAAISCPRKFKVC